MSFLLKYAEEADAIYKVLKGDAIKAFENRKRTGKTKASKQEGIFKQVLKTLDLLAEDPRHPSLRTHEYSVMPNPLNPSQKVFEAYAQNNTPGAYRVFGCYGPEKGDITVITITAHP